MDSITNWSDLEIQLDCFPTARNIRYYFSTLRYSHADSIVICELSEKMCRVVEERENELLQCP